MSSLHTNILQFYITFFYIKVVFASEYHFLYCGEIFDTEKN